MQTVYAQLPENPNVTLKLRVSSEKNNTSRDHDIYERHFSSRAGRKKRNKNIGFLFADTKRNPPFTEAEVEKAPLREFINIANSFFNDETEDEDLLEEVNKWIVNAIRVFEQQILVNDELIEGWLPANLVKKDNVKNLKNATEDWLIKESNRIEFRGGGNSGVDTFIANAFGDLKQIIRELEETETESSFEEELQRDVNALAATLQEYHEELQSKEQVGPMVETQLDRFFEDKVAKAFNVAWTQQQREKIKQAALAWLYSKVFKGERAQQQQNIIVVNPPQVEVTEEQKFVKRLEDNLDDIMRRALSPLYSFVGGVAVALSETDVRRFYKYKGQRGITVEELQSPVKKGNTSIQSFYNANKHLGNVLLQYAVNVQVRKDQAQQQQQQQQQIQRRLIGDQQPLNFAGVVGRQGVYRNDGANLQLNFNQMFRSYARANALLPVDGNHPDVADWYWCAMPYAVFQDMLTANLVAAMEMAASDIWRFTGREDFTIPLMIKSVDTRDVFVLMVRNKYIISTGSIYSESVNVNFGNGRQGGSKRLQTGSGSIIREKRAAENLAGKYWWQDVVLVKQDPNRERRERLNRIKQEDEQTLIRLRELIRLATEYQNAQNLQDENPGYFMGRLANLENDILGVAGVGEDDIQRMHSGEAVLSEIQRDAQNFIKGKKEEIEEIRLRQHCYETMMYHLKYIHKPMGLYNGGSSFLRSHGRGFY